MLKNYCSLTLKFQMDGLLGISIDITQLLLLFRRENVLFFLLMTPGGNVFLSEITKDLLSVIFSIWMRLYFLLCSSRQKFSC